MIGYKIASKYDVKYDICNVYLPVDILKELLEAFEVNYSINRDEDSMEISSIDIESHGIYDMIRYLCNYPYMYESSEIVKKCYEKAELKAKDNQTKPECLGEFLKEWFLIGNPDMDGWYHLIYC